MPSTAIKIAGQLRPCLRLSTCTRSSSLRSLLRRTYATELDLPALDGKWQGIWEKKARFEKMRTRAQTSGNQVYANPVWPKSTGRNMYILPMFPYPSGDLHLGHLRVYTIADVVARFRRLQGFEVLLPMGWDAFGLPAENAAIERGVDPADWTMQNIYRMRAQLDMMNASFDWSREFATCSPDYYVQTQRIFLLLHKHGLAVQKLASVNWDPVDKTVLANEQVDSEGRSWRSGAKVEQRELNQWFFRTTKLREALLQDLDGLAEDNAWPERVLTMQKNWLGLTQAARYKFPIENLVLYMDDKRRSDIIEVYTTRPETIFAVQFIALSRDAPIVRKAAAYDSGLAHFLHDTRNSPLDSTEGYKIQIIKAYNPLHCPGGKVMPETEALPVYVAAYVRGDHKSGAIMGVPAHDARDFAFWKRHNPDKPIKYAITPHPNGYHDPETDKPFLEDGYMTEASPRYFRKRSNTVANDFVPRLRTYSGLAVHYKTWKIRDWLISRQRYWGTPIPIIHCKLCGPQPVPDKDLPVELPPLGHHWEEGRTGNPLEQVREWVNTYCPKCFLPAKRDTDTMDTFVDSSWYYMRFADPTKTDGPISKSTAEKLLPVDLYIGGVEHAILHLLYARFIYKAVMGILYSQGAKPDGENSAMDAVKDPKPLGNSSELRNSSAEPFKRLVTQGMVHGKTYTDPSSGRFLKPNEVDLSNPSVPIIIETGLPARVTFEKMSKSKYNGVDPTSFILEHGADATRAHILFQAPVGEVLNWDESKITGITRWLHRVYDHVQALVPTGISSTPSVPEFSGKNYFNKPESVLQAMSKEEAAQWDADITIWRATQKAIMYITKAFQDVYSLNTAVSTLMSLTNTVIDSQAASTLVKYEATTRLLRMMAPITPAFSEECWSILRSTEKKSIFAYGRWGWPAPDGSLFLLEPLTTMCAVQINGKLRCVVTIPAKPEDMEVGSDEHKNWVMKEILGAPEAQNKLVAPQYDIQRAEKMFIARNGGLINFIIPKEQEE